MHNIGTMPRETRSLRHDRAAARLCMAFATAATLKALEGPVVRAIVVRHALSVTNALASMSRARIVKNTEALQQQAAATLRASMNWSRAKRTADYRVEAVVRLINSRQIVQCLDTRIRRRFGAVGRRQATSGHDAVGDHGLFATPTKRHDLQSARAVQGRSQTRRFSPPFFRTGRRVRDAILLLLFSIACSRRRAGRPVASCNTATMTPAFSKASM